MLPDLTAGVLVIDDDPFMREFAKVVFEQAGFEVEVVATCREGLAKAATTDFALILLDYAMPGGDGLHFLRSMRSIVPNTSSKIIVLSAWRSDEVRTEVERLGALWLDKPVSAAHLLNAVQRAFSTGGS